jgi:hypothetical protein
LSNPIRLQRKIKKAGSVKEPAERIPTYLAVKNNRRRLGLYSRESSYAVYQAQNTKR